MKKLTRIISLVLAAITLSSMLVSCSKDEKYEAYDRTGEPYDYYLPDYVKVCDYKGIELPVVKYVPTREDLDNRVKQLAGYYCDRIEDPDRPCRNYDYVDIITTCKFKDTGETYALFNFEKRDDGLGQTFLLGTNNFGFPALDAAVLGMSQGETKTVTLTLPDPFYKDYMNSGREVEMEIYLNYIDEVVYEGIDDQFYHDHYGYYGEAMDMYISEEMIKEKTEDIEGYQAALAWKYVVDNSELKKVPEKEYKKIYDGTLASARSAAQEADMTLLEYVKKNYGHKTLEEYYESLDEYAKNTCLEDMIFYYIMRRENLTYTNEFYDERVLKMAADFQIDDPAEAEDFLIYYMGAEGLHNNILVQYTREWLVEQGKIREDVNQFFSDKLN